jgi:hypothetical protein
MGAHVVDDRHQVETGTTNPVAERTPIQIDSLPFEDLGLTVERQIIPELCDDDEPISARCRFIAAMLTCGSTRAAPTPRAGQTAPKR